MAAVRVGIQWFGVHKTLTREQKSEAANAFGAEGTFLSAGKKLIDTSHPAFKAVTAVRGRILGLWKAESLPFPEPGVRLIRQDRIEPFDERMQELREELGEAVRRLDEIVSKLRSAARRRLGRLLNAADHDHHHRIKQETRHRQLWHTNQYALDKPHTDRFRKKWGLSNPFSVKRRFVEAVTWFPC